MILLHWDGRDYLFFLKADFVSELNSTLCDYFYIDFIAFESENGAKRKNKIITYLKFISLDFKFTVGMKETKLL